jgi:methylated-DNA-[protein]-cysteine S-methyltransferase
MKLWRDRLASPIGTILLVSDGEALRALDFEDCEARMHVLLRRQYGDFGLSEGRAADGARLHLRDYFEGDLAAPERIAVRTEGSTFQRGVWAALREIPPGETRSYGQIATAIGRPTATRAVGLANGANPVAIVVPCHRVIGADGSLTGYGGGLPRKAWLLEHERPAVRPRGTASPWSYGAALSDGSTAV